MADDTCAPWINTEVRSNEQYGRYLVATRWIEVGDVVLDEEPLVTVPREWANDDPDFQDTPVALVPHVMAMRAVCALDVDIREQICDMYVPAEDSTAPVLDRSLAAAEHAKSTGTFPWAEHHTIPSLQRMALAMDLNAHRFDRKYRALFPKGSKLVHSCSPNTLYTSAGGKKGRHIAIQAIPPETPITTNYLGPWLLLPTPRRRRHLEVTKLFTCNCPRCLAPDPCRAVPCPDCHPRNTHDPTLPQQLALSPSGGQWALYHSTVDQWVCEGCQGKFSEDNLGVPTEVMTKLEEHVLAVDQTLETDPNQTYDGLMGLWLSCLKMLGRRHWAGAKMVIIMCEWLEGRVQANVEEEFLSKEDAAYLIDELVGSLQSLWSWFAEAQLPNVASLYWEVFVSGCTTLHGAGVDSGVMDPLERICAGVLPYVRLTHGVGSEQEVRAATAARREPGEGADTLYEALKQWGNEAFQASEPEKYVKAPLWYSQAFLVRCAPELFSNRSAAWRKLSRFTDAIQDAECCVRLRPEWAKGYLRLAMAYDGMGDQAAALTAMNRALEVDPGNADLLKMHQQLTGEAPTSSGKKKKKRR